MYVGAIIPWYAYNDPVTGLTPWRIVVLAICVMLFRRLPWVVAIVSSHKLVVMRCLHSFVVQVDPCHFVTAGGYFYRMVWAHWK